MTAALETAGLTKRFGSNVAVRDLDLSVQRGELLGLLGPNGAGKTTTLRMLLGLARPTAGSARVLGGAPGDPDVLSRVGAVVEEPAFYPHMTGRDNLRTLATTGGSDPARIAVVLDQVSLADRADEKVKGYSQGMRQRLGIAAALLGDPELLLLDEPTNGLDPAGIAQMRTWLEELVAEGRTVVLSSHQLGEVEQICERVAVLSDGRLIADARVDELRPQEALAITATPLARARDVALGVDGVLEAEERDGWLRVRIDPGTAADLNDALVGHGIRVSALYPTQRSLEEVFLEMTDRGTTQDGGGSG